MKNSDKDIEMEYLLEIDVNYPIELHELHVDLAFLSERMKIDICEKLVFNLYDKKNYASRH